jgi:hypothetical protein
VNREGDVRRHPTARGWDTVRGLWLGDFLKRPLLAHYTSLPVLEQILRNNEIWLSNPLFMTDIEEVRFGIEHGKSLALDSELLSSACQTPQRAEQFKQHFFWNYQRFANDHAIDTYVFCLSDHLKADDDGILSMWRGYGGNGNGVALVIDTAAFAETPDSPLLLAKVQYETREGRIAWLNKKIEEFASILRANPLSDDKLSLAAFYLFERMKLFSLFSKHRGFSEEQEWRVVYTKRGDPEGRLASFLGYSVGAQGVEPKLKLKIQPIPGSTAKDFSMRTILDRILLGPHLSNPLSQAAICRMLDHLGLLEFRDKLRMSSIPFRARVSG